MKKSIDRDEPPPFSNSLQRRAAAMSGRSLNFLSPGRLAILSAILLFVYTVGTIAETCSQAPSPDEPDSDILYCLHLSDCNKRRDEGRPDLPACKHMCNAISINNLHNIIVLNNGQANPKLDPNEATLFKYTQGAMCGQPNRRILPMLQLTNGDGKSNDFYTEDNCHQECRFGCHEVSMTGNLAAQLKDMEFDELKLYTCNGWPNWLWMVVTAVSFSLLASLVVVGTVIVMLVVAKREKPEEDPVAA